MILRSDPIQRSRYSSSVMAPGTGWYPMAPIKKLGGGNSKGFSLLEMLAVLAIIGIVVSSVGPALNNMLGAMSFSSKSDQILREISQMRVKALLEKRRFVFPQTIGGAITYRDLATELPEGWAIEGTAIAFLETGVCLGGTLTIKDNKGRQKTAQFSKPDCKFIQTNLG